jgi:hypothetical protein
MSLPTNFFIGRGGGASFPDPIWSYAVGQSITFENFNRTTQSFSGTTLTEAKNALQSISAYSYGSWGPSVARFAVPTQGYMDWLVPVSGVWQINLQGAKGGDGKTSLNGSGGNGGLVRAKFILPAGCSLRFICGATGYNESGEGSGGGGGGTFVFYGSGLTNDVRTNSYALGSSDTNIKSHCMLVAGGGGGGSHNSTSITYRNGTNAYSGSEAIGGSGRGNISRGHQLAEDSPIQLGYGQNGYGGTPYTVSGQDGDWSGGGGAGIITDGSYAQNNGGSSANPAKRYNAGFIGGEGSHSYGVNGGFGGGGMGSWGGAGGGGYSGGEADYTVGNNADASGGGGGGNFINTGFSFSGEQSSYVSYDQNTAGGGGGGGNATISLIEAY